MATQNPLVYTKDLNAATFGVDLTAYLAPGDAATSVTVQSISPTTTPAFTVTGTTVTSATNISVGVNGGAEGLSYGVALQVTTVMSNVVTVTLAVLVKTDLNVPYATRNPAGFQSLLGSIEAGDAAVGKAFFVLPPTTPDIYAGYVTWDIVDHQGTTYASGNAYTYTVNLSSLSAVVSADAVVNVPSTMPPSQDGQAYQLRWLLTLPDGSTQSSAESLSITSLITVPLGVADAVELEGDFAQLSLVTPRAYANVFVELYHQNTKVVTALPVIEKSRVASGWYYSITIDTSMLTAQLEAYTVAWKYYDAPNMPVQRETGRLYLLNPSILSCIDDIRQKVQKARATTMGFDDSMFDTATIVSWLRRGRDNFNGAGGLITQFTMTNAQGSIREYWLKYTEMDMLRAQYLAEGEKAFDFQGQAISLNVDRTQYYQTLADNLQSELDQHVPLFKRTLSIKGNTSGDGSLIGTATGAMGIVGLSYNAVSPGYPINRPGLR